MTRPETMPVTRTMWNRTLKTRRSLPGSPREGPGIATALAGGADVSGWRTTITATPRHLRVQSHGQNGLCVAKSLDQSLQRSLGVKLLAYDGVAVCMNFGHACSVGEYPRGRDFLGPSIVQFFDFAVSAAAFSTARAALS